MATSSSSTSSVIPASFPVQPSQPAVTDKQAAMEELAKKARIAQLAAQLRLRLSYTGYKSTHKLSNVPFATLEKRLEEEVSTPKAVPTILLLDPLSTNDEKGMAEARLMPPPSMPTYTTNSLYSSILDSGPPERPAKRQKVDENGASRAFAPSPAFLLGNSETASVNGTKGKRPITPPPSHKTHSSASKSRTSAQKLHKATLNASPRRKSATKKSASSKAKDAYAMASSEQQAAEALASLLAFRGSPNTGKRPSGSMKSSSSVVSSSFVGGAAEGAKKKSIRRTPSSVSMSSIDAAMADANLSTSGVDTTTADGSGIDTVPGSPIATSNATLEQDKEDVAEMLLLFAQSPSPARNPARRAPIANVEGRVLFAEGSGTSEGSGAATAAAASTDGKGTTISRAASGASLPGSASGAPTSRTPSLLLPPPPSPTKKSSTPKPPQENYAIPFTVSFPANQPGSSSGQPQLQAPFTPGPPGAAAYFNPSASFNSSNPFGTGFALGLGGMGPSTPQGLSFNMADYINFTPTPGGGLSPAPRGSAKGGSAQAQAMQGMAMGPGMPLMQSIFAGGYGTSPGMPMMASVMAPAPKKEGEKKKKKANTGANGGGKTPASSSSASQTPVLPPANTRTSSDASNITNAARTGSEAPKAASAGSDGQSEGEKKSEAA